MRSNLYRVWPKINIVECGNIYDTLMTVMSAAPWFAMLLRVLGVTTFGFVVREVLSYRAEGQSLRQEYPGVSAWRRSPSSRPELITL
jgi:hypothetical protein